MRAVLALKSGEADRLESIFGDGELGRVTAPRSGWPNRGAPRRTLASVSGGAGRGDIGRALLPDGGAISYPEVGAYRYLVHICPTMLHKIGCGSRSMS